MHASQKIPSLGGLPIWDLSPVAAMAVTFAVLFGLFNLAVAKEGFFSRGRYLSLVVNFGLLIPAYVGFTTVVLQHAGPTDAWFAQSWWQVVVVALAVAYLVGFSWFDFPNYEPEQLSSPAKLTFTGLMFLAVYWLVAPLPALIDRFEPTGAAIAALAALVGCLAVWGLDRVVYWFGGTEDPHVKYNYRTKTATPRFVEVDKRGPKAGSAARPS